MNEKRWEYERNSECWYKDVCDNECVACARYIEMKALMDASGLPRVRQTPIVLQAGRDIEQFERLAEIKNNVVDYIEQGKNLYICSKTTGNGKTSWAIKLMLKYFDSIWAGNGLRPRAMIVHVPTLLAELKNFDKPLNYEYQNNLNNMDLIIWDDIAHSDISKYEYSRLIVYLENRIFNKKSNIFTSNIISKEELQNCVGAKLASRIWEVSEIIIFKGKDRR